MQEQLIAANVALPPNEITEITTTWNIWQDISLIQFLPHSHLFGKTWEIYAETTNETIPDTIENIAKFLSFERLSIPIMINPIGVKIK